MKPNGRCFLMNPIKYQHECDNCGNTETFLKNYPFISTEKI